MTDKQIHTVRSEYTRILGYAPEGIFLAAGLWRPAETIVALREIPDGAGQAALDAAMDPVTMGQTVRRLWLEVLNAEDNA